MKIDGRKIAKEIIENLKREKTPSKILAAIWIGDDPRSGSFLKQKERVAKELGIDFRIYQLDAGLKNDALRKEIGRIARQKRVGGAIIQLPLPEGVGRRYVLNTVPPAKDADALGERKGGQILQPAVETVKEIVGRENIELSRARVVVVGAGILIGKPIAEWLKDKCGELYVLDSKSDPSKISDADLVISGVGTAGLVDPKNLRDGAGVIDFGYSHDKNGKPMGDLAVDNDAALQKLKFYTPTPGGTGPILVAKLFENFYKLCAQQ